MCGKFIPINEGHSVWFCISKWGFFLIKTKNKCELEKENLFYLAD